MHGKAPRPRLLVIGAGEFQLPLVKHAAKTCDVLVAAPAVSDAFEPYASEVLIADVRDFDRIIGFADGSATGRPPIDGVITDGTDIPVLTVARVADRLGLPGIGEECARLFTSKSLMRSRMEELGLPVLPHTAACSLGEALSFYDAIGGDVIIKPSDMQGSRGVQVCRDRGELIRKFDEALRWSSEGVVVVERFAMGREFVIEGLALDYRFMNLCMGDTEYFKLYDSFSASQRTFPTTADDELRARVLDLNTQIVTGFGLRQGITHSEFIMDGGEVYLIETAARGGGAFISSDLIPLSCGVSSEEFLVGAALGRWSSFDDVPSIGAGPWAAEPDWFALHPRCHCGYLAFYIPAGEVLVVRGVDEVLALPYVHDTQIANLGALVGTCHDETLSDKTSRYLVTVSADTRDALERRMEEVRNTLQVDVRRADGSIAGLIWT